MHDVSWTFSLYKHFLLFQYIFIAATYLSDYHGHKFVLSAILGKFSLTNRLVAKKCFHVMCYIFLLFHANVDTFLKVQWVSASLLKEFFIICLALIEKKLFVSIWPPRL